MMKLLINENNIRIAFVEEKEGCSIKAEDLEIGVTYRFPVNKNPDEAYLEIVQNREEYKERQERNKRGRVYDSEERQKKADILREKRINHRIKNNDRFVPFWESSE